MAKVLRARVPGKHRPVVTIKLRGSRAEYSYTYWGTVDDRQFQVYQKAVDAIRDNGINIEAAKPILEADGYTVEISDEPD